MDIKHASFLYHWYKVKEHAHTNHWNKYFLKVYYMKVYFMATFHLCRQGS
jgi:hypothetical protein